MTRLREFDPDALMEALPRREIRRLARSVVGRVKPVEMPQQSSLGLPGGYSGFSAKERTRTASVSNRLAKLGSAERPATCSICRASADDEHAENYYDLASWVGLCRQCHRSALHGRFARPRRWFELLDLHEVPEGHWARLVAMYPFDLAGLLRARGLREPTLADFVST